MLHKHIASTLPEGVGQPVYSRLLTGQTPSPWVRCGEVRREGHELTFVPAWDGEAFAILWERAVTTEVMAKQPAAQFAVAQGRRLRLIADVILESALERSASRASRDAERARRGWRVGRHG